jgi:2-octaprenyl-6-methoxyphenol hydroxylase
MQKIAVLGLGLNGLAFAYSCAKLGIYVTIFDENPFKNTFKNDLRTSFISASTMKFLDGISQNIISQAGTIEYIYSFKEHGNSVIELFGSNMGYIVDNFLLKTQMAGFIEKSEFVTIKDHTKIESLISQAENTIINGETFALTVCGLGKNASIIQNLNIKNTHYNYTQTAFVFDISHTLPHKNIAVELFGEGYILAVLPKKNELVSSVILNIENEKAAMSDTQVLEFLQNLSRLRHIGKIEKIITNVLQYPLSSNFLHAQNKDSIFFIGDTFHNVHPVLGQGFNMSIKDIQALSNHILESQKLGIPLHIGLETLATKNIPNHLKIGLATHFFAKAFITKSKVLNFATNTMLQIGSKIPAKLTSKILHQLL